MPRPLTIVGLLICTIALFAGGWLARGVINNDDAVPLTETPQPTQTPYEQRLTKSEAAKKGATFVIQEYGERVGDVFMNNFAEGPVCETEDFNARESYWVVRCTGLALPQVTERQERPSNIPVEDWFDLLSQDVDVLVAVVDQTGDTRFIR